MKYKCCPSVLACDLISSTLKSDWNLTNPNHTIDFTYIGIQKFPDITLEKQHIEHSGKPNFTQSTDFKTIRSGSEKLLEK